MTKNYFYVTATGELIRAARQSKNLSQSEVSSLLNLKIGRKLTRGFISHVEQGKRKIKSEDALALCQLLGVKLEDAFHADLKEGI